MIVWPDIILRVDNREYTVIAFSDKLFEHVNTWYLGNLSTTILIRSCKDLLKVRWCDYAQKDMREIDVNEKDT